MKNHFFIPYTGNKRTEVEFIYSNLNLDDITTIIEPYCGSCAMSYYISTLHPKKFKYILNDIEKNLIELLNVAKDPKRLQELTDEINKMCFKDDKFIDKESYNKILKDNNLKTYIIGHKFYKIRSGLYPQDRYQKKLNFEGCPIVKFLRDENVEILNSGGLEVIEKNKNDKHTLIFNDPPYLSSSYNFYSSNIIDNNVSNFNIYEYLYKNDMTKFNCKFYLVLEDIWIIKLLFDKFKDKTIQYNKKYETTKRETQHIIIRNRI
jgi:site-specific DNA-adenine methylase